MCTSSRSPDAAEMTKLLENTFRAVNIALANEFAESAGALGIDVIEVIDAAATKPYGFMPFYPGPGVGGHCIPCDPHYLLWQLRASAVDAPVIETGHGRHRRPARTGWSPARRDALRAAAGPIAGARVLVVGVAYKPDVEDLRESPALEIMQALRDAGSGGCVHRRPRLERSSARRHNRGSHRAHPSGVGPRHRPHPAH